MWQFGHTHRHSVIALFLLTGFLPVTQASEETAEAFLQEQIRLGTSTGNKALVAQSLHRLALIKPNDPNILLMQIQLATKQKDNTKAQQLFSQLGAQFPQSEQYQRAIKTLSLTTDVNRQKLQRAQLYRTAGRYDEALNLYDEIYRGVPPDETLALEYIQVLMHSSHDDKIDRLNHIYHQYPQNEKIASLYQQQSTIKSAVTTSTVSTVSTAKPKTDVASLPIATLKQKVRQQPDNADVVGALGVRYSRENQRGAAIFYLSQALKLSPSHDNSGQWQAMLQANQYWHLLSKGDEALLKQDYPLAEHYFRQLNKLAPYESEPYIGLGNIAVAQHQLALAESYYLQALKYHSNHSATLHSLAKLYRQQSHDKAQQFIDGLTPRQYKNLAEDYGYIISGIRQDLAADDEHKERYLSAIEKRKAIAKDYPDDVWNIYHLTDDLLITQQGSVAEAYFNQLNRRLPNDPSRLYAYALYLNKTERETQALDTLKTIPLSQRSESMKALDSRLRFGEIVAHAESLRAKGQEQHAVDYLFSHIPPEQKMQIYLLLANWAQERNNLEQALSYYHTALNLESNNETALLGATEIALAQGQKAQAKYYLAKIATLSPSQFNNNAIRRVANAEKEVGNTEKAQHYFAYLTQQIETEPDSADPLILRDIARFHRDERHRQQAHYYYQHAMLKDGIADRLPKDNIEYTRLMRNNENDNWLSRSLRADAHSLYRQQEWRFTLEHDYWGSNGSEGYSKLRAHTTMLQLDHPVYNGRFFWRADLVNLNSGKLGTSPYDAKFGTCYRTGCFPLEQKSFGVSPAIGWENVQWQWDLGTTPLGFEVTDWVGKIAYSHDLFNVGWTLDAHRRPVNSSLLAFGGQRDIWTNQIWGGVRRTGVRLSGSYDLGGKDGYWGEISIDKLTGKNVEDNSSVRGMGGYYYKLINENNRRVSIGLNTMLWHYDKDLSGYTLGQGGYYSPQKYVSLGLPINYRERTENWSWELSGSVSWSYSQTDDRKRYPLQYLISPDNFNRYMNGLSPEDREDMMRLYYQEHDAIDEGGSSNGFGYTARALVEHRITPHWFIGAAIDIQQAKNYTPSHALMYLRYSFDGWNGDLDLPPNPLIPYADFK
ncbi:cellulose synthase complex outer membrane protein BcsC [Proteus faecis]|uniref:Cellulose synthase complex outer membrane protein BcsC n=1 Tax=Proteus faecis TaxID=2050967 RepID=A0AAW7CJN6_9GAMM|nr:cellulose synthase complex outer membrane protein BcsC [Proteus faecis]MDL5166422.1 cellulose synthase complex outer membrane protein BcsC [Proteus faecis]MDL5274406.1 cellulose synthase complex outer membrane protein BcsC [Proteus faecis]MDL5277976.1 cellulose synthase complex outer membrane protein BcsC [Proteus faecis]MDL5306978.1 cellulose synthase complex outer membrane protein BcsC [Proteus faecis]MDL5310534.1 cellulose synthase complex outer membrane protein BcsC [Proteus faecis]